MKGFSWKNKLAFSQPSEQIWVNSNILPWTTTTTQSKCLSHNIWHKKTWNSATLASLFCFRRGASREGETRFIGLVNAWASSVRLLELISCVWEVVLSSIKQSRSPGYTHFGSKQPNLPKLLHPHVIQYEEDPLSLLSIWHTHILVIPPLPYPNSLSTPLHSLVTSMPN